MLRQAMVLAAALVAAPLGAKAADLVVWWDEGYYPEEGKAVREIIAAFEQELWEACRDYPESKFRERMYPHPGDVWR